MLLIGISRYTEAVDAFKPYIAEKAPRGHVGRVNRQSAVAALAALGFETRLETVRLLASVGEEGLPAGEIALRLGVQQNTLSDHLKALSQAGVLGSERRSRSVIYRSNDAVIRELAAYLVEHCLTDSR